jgi:hypothetical protein
VHEGESKPLSGACGKGKQVRSLEFGCGSPGARHGRFDASKGSAFDRVGEVLLTASTADETVNDRGGNERKQDGDAQGSDDADGERSKHVRAVADAPG